MFRTSHAELLLQPDTAAIHIGYAARDRTVVLSVDKRVDLLVRTARRCSSSPLVSGCLAVSAAAVSFPLLRQSQVIYRSVSKFFRKTKTAIGNGFSANPHAPCPSDSRLRHMLICLLVQFQVHKAPVLNRSDCRDADVLDRRARISNVFPLDPQGH